MVTFCEILHEAKQKKTKQTLESAQYGLEISFKLSTDASKTLYKYE